MHLKLNNVCYYLIISSLLFSCKPVTHLQVLKPAQLVIPDHIQKILLVDRSKPSGGWLRNLESVFTGEEFQQDQQGRRRAMESLTAVLGQTPRFQIISPGIEIEGSRGGRTMMTPMSWYEVQDYCKKYDAQAIVAIEMFDSDIQATTSPRTVKEKDKNGKETTKIVYDGKKHGRVNLGWRMYDVKNKTIVDEYRDSDTEETSSYAAVSAQVALDNMTRSYELVRTIASKLGDKYGRRIAPVYITLGRTYFKTVKTADKDKFEQAARYADAKEWHQASGIWEKIASSRDKESAGKATFNLAVAAEVNGQLSLALQLAKDAYTQFGLKQAKPYIATLEQRLADQEVLSRQMHEKKKT